MKRLTFLIIGTLLAANASADGWHADRNNFRVIEEIETAHQISHNKHKKRHVDKRHDSKQHPGKNRFEDNRGHDRRTQYNNERPHNDHRSHNKGGRYSDDQNHKYRDRTDNRHGQQQRNRNWQTVSNFRGRSGKVVTRQFRVGEKVNALSIEGTKRGMVIRRAHALLGTGRWVRLEGLEGHITNGERARHRLHNSRFVRRVELEIGPGRYKRGYGKLQVSSAR
ncbi:MAG: hypothetical protein ACI805_002423 [Candidatus Azotimanducaceae bacterium]|jgi:hypothetical protein